MSYEIEASAFAAAHADGGLVVDVREPAEYVGGHVPGARLIPMAALPGAVRDLPRTEPIYVICASGNRSKAMTGLLRNAGLEAFSVVGGTTGWINAGRPVVTGTSAGQA